MTRISRAGFLLAATLFTMGVVLQVFLAGMVVVAGRMGWSNHAGLGHGLAFPLLVMLIAAYAGRLPGRIKRLTWLLFLVYIIQADVIIFLRSTAPLLSAFHPVLALVDFALGLILVRAAWPLAQSPDQPRPARRPAEAQAGAAD